ncbi:MAG: beta-lactamase family protein [Chlamydiia bacterium]|nr:beta-lactamase family protein [Chlamydiia bacterium]MCP5509985.1 beta-lactamase family protein [Chlamydiales bacterium]
MNLSNFQLNESHHDTLLDRVIKQELDRLQQKYGFPGATCSYVLSDGTLGEIASGFADRENRKLMTTRSRMLVASIGKSFVAATVLALANERLLNLDDLLSSSLGKHNWYTRLPNHETISIRHLLTHSAGLPDHVHNKKFLQLLSNNNLLSAESLLECILDEPPLFDAGNGWSYTDTGYILLGLVIESVTERTYYEEVERRFLLPLKLNNTTPSNQPMLLGLVPGYTACNNPFGLPRKTVNATGSLVWNPAIEWTGGGLISTSRDLAIWAKLLYEGNAMQSNYLTELLHSVPVGEIELEKRYGAGVVIIEKNPLGEKLGHLGVIPGYTSSMQYYSKHRTSIAFQVNTDENVTSFVNEIEQLLAGTIIKNNAHNFDRTY